MSVKPKFPEFSTNEDKSLFVNGKLYEPKFLTYSCVEDYKKDGLVRLEPMLATALETEEEQNEYCLKDDFCVEEKFDGTRATLHFKKDSEGNGYCRCFSRRESVKTGWLSENTDSVPQLRELNIPELDGTIIDGEMFIDGRPFKDVAAIMNCNWDKAVSRQLDMGFVTLHAFDICYFKGIKVENMSLRRRKYYLQRVIDLLEGYHFITMVPYFEDFVPLRTPDSLIPFESAKDKYPELWRCLKENQDHKVKEFGTGADITQLSKKAYYEYIVMHGGEGAILKPMGAKYEHKRTRSYLKIKKFLTREVIIMGFTEPTTEYKGKFPTIEAWDYWETQEQDVVDLSEMSITEREQFKNYWYPNECSPVSKFYAKGWIGNIRFGVIITQAEIDKLPKNKKFNIERCNFFHGGEEHFVLEVGECSGFDEEMREYLTEHQSEVLGRVFEVKANELFKDTGKLRHPRFLRMRDDKNATDCKWGDYVSQGF